MGYWATTTFTLDLGAVKNWTIEQLQGSYILHFVLFKWHSPEPNIRTIKENKELKQCTSHSYIREKIPSHLHLHPKFGEHILKNWHFALCICTQLLCAYKCITNVNLEEFNVITCFLRMQWKTINPSWLWHFFLLWFKNVSFEQNITSYIYLKWG